MELQKSPETAVLKRLKRCRENICSSARLEHGVAAAPDGMQPREEPPLVFGFESTQFLYFVRHVLWTSELGNLLGLLRVELCNGNAARGLAMFFPPPNTDLAFVLRRLLREKCFLVLFPDLFCPEHANVNAIFSASLVDDVAPTERQRLAAVAYQLALSSLDLVLEILHAYDVLHAFLPTLVIVHFLLQVRRRIATQAACVAAAPLATQEAVHFELEAWAWILGRHGVVHLGGPVAHVALLGVPSYRF